MTVVRKPSHVEKTPSPGKPGRRQRSSIFNAAQENELARRVQEEDEKALIEFYEHFFQPLYTYFYRQTLNVRDAEDLTTSTFLLALQGLRGVVFTRGCAPWLFGIACTVLRTRGTDLSLAHLSTLTIEQLEQQGQKVLEEMQSWEKLDLLWQLVEGLPADIQQILILRYKNGLTYREIALLMQLTVTQCKALHGRAMKRLRDSVRKTYDDTFSFNSLLP